MGSSGSQLNAKAIFDVGFAFWPSKILLSAVSLGLFTLLAKNKKMGVKQIAVALDFKCSVRQLCDYLDVMVALGFLSREGLLQSSVYCNTPNADHFLDREKSSYIGGIMEMLNVRLYSMWGTLETSLKTGLPHFQNYSNGVSTFSEIYKNPQMLKNFVDAMTAMQAKCNEQFTASFDFSKYSTLVDAGGAGASLSTEVARKNPHMKCISLDLPPVEPLARENIERLGLADRVEARSGDFFKEELPKADVVTMGFILHDWGMEEKQLLIRRAFDAVNPGGAFVAIETIIDEQRKQNLFGLSMSVNMLIETPGGFDFSFSEFTEWTKAAGFKETKLIQLDQFKKAAIAYK